MFGKLAQVASGAVRVIRQNRPAFLISASLCIVSLTLYAATYLHANPLLRFLDNIELKTLDVRFQMRGARRPGPAVVIVAIDQKSQDLLGRWPFPRSAFAQAVDFLREAHARVIAFDVNFPQVDANSGLEALRSVRKDYDLLVDKPLHTPSFESKLKSREAAADNDQQFADALSRFDNVVLGYFFIPPDEAKSQNQERLKQFLDVLSFQAYPQIVHPEYAKNFEGPEALGDLSRSAAICVQCQELRTLYTDPDADGTVRRAPAVVEFQNSFYPSLDVAAALAYTDISLDQVKVILNRTGVKGLRSASSPSLRTGGASSSCNHHGPAGTFPTYPLADVVQRQLSPELFRNRLVLIRRHRNRHWRHGADSFSAGAVSRRGSARHHD